MEAEAGNARSQFAPGQRSDQENVPGVKDSLVLVMDSLLTLAQLFKSEASQAIKHMPLLLAIDVYRIPAHWLTWISFCAFAACGVQVWTGKILLSCGTFFVMQLCLTGLLEWQAHQLQQKVGFRETRKGLAALYASLKERLSEESKVSSKV